MNGIACRLRQSVKPGEVTPEEAHQIGYEPASGLLKGEHAFIVAARNDRRQVKDHIVFALLRLTVSAANARVCGRKE